MSFLSKAKKHQPTSPNLSWYDKLKHSNPKVAKELKEMVRLFEAGELQDNIPTRAELYRFLKEEGVNVPNSYKTFLDNYQRIKDELA